MNKQNDKASPGPGNPNGQIKEAVHIKTMYGNWFLDYASYVILERAVPAIEDGLKPVQRRILFSMKQMDDGRFNKVANIIGHTMQYHPHGDAAIGDALVNLGQKVLMIEPQGNWGDMLTGDRAAAPRYIEARLSAFALEVAFNANTTQWQLSYDGRKKEPVYLPMKFPLLLAQGADGIAVGLATKVMPHNFQELIHAAIDLLRDREATLLPDFPTGGLADVRNYNEGRRGGKIRVRARIEIADKKTLIIRDIPYGTTTTALMESIVKANENGKIKIKRVIDNTSKQIEIIVELPPGISPELTMDALYAFTECEISISPNACVIMNERPVFVGVIDILRQSTESTVALLKQELEIKHNELSEKWHFSSLEKIFIEKRIYRRIEECESFEAVIKTVDQGLKPYKKLFKREITQDDIVRLIEIRIKRISKYNVFKADEEIKAIEAEISQVAHHLAHLIDYAVAYFESLLERYGPGRERKTEICSFDTVQVTQVAVANQKLYVNRKDGFVGYGIKKEEYVCDCSDLADIIVFLKNGTFLVTRVTDKTFVGRDIIYAAVWDKNDSRMVYNLAYHDGATGAGFVKRFSVTAVTRDRPYEVTQGTEGSEVLYFTANPNGESEVVTVHLSPKSRARKKVFDFDFSTLDVKGRGSKGNILSRYRVQRVVQKTVGTSTLGGMDIWYDDTIGKLNTQARGRRLGSFDGDDRILAISKDGTVRVTSFALTNQYPPGTTVIIEKYRPEAAVSIVYLNGEKKQHFVKRFRVDGLPFEKPVGIIPEVKGSSVLFASTLADPVVEMQMLKGQGKKKVREQINLKDAIDVKGLKAAGNRLSQFRITGINPVEKAPPAPKPDKKGKGRKTSARRRKKTKAQYQPDLF